MVLVSLVNGIDTVKKWCFPVRFVPRNRIFIIASADHNIPGTVGFHIVFVDQVETVYVTQLIKSGIVRIVAGTDRVDVVAFHGNHILNKLFRLRNAACKCAEFMAVGAFEYDSLSIQEHEAVLQFKTAETDAFCDHFCNLSGFILNGQKKFIQVRHFGAPEPEALERKAEMAFTVREGKFGFGKFVRRFIARIVSCAARKMV